MWDTAAPTLFMAVNHPNQYVDCKYPLAQVLAQDPAVSAVEFCPPELCHILPYKKKGMCT